MRVGWSGETSTNIWQKADIELEEDDLSRLLREADLPEGLAVRLPAKVCYQLMQNEAEIMLMTKLMNLGYPDVQANERIAQLLRANEAIITAIKSKLQPA